MHDWRRDSSSRVASDSSNLVEKAVGFLIYDENTKPFKPRPQSVASMSIDEWQLFLAIKILCLPPNFLRFRGY